MYRRGKQARLLTNGIIGVSTTTTGRRGVGSVDGGSPPITNAVDLDGSADYLSRTPASTGDTKKFTVSCWAKFANGNQRSPIFTAFVDASNNFFFERNSNGKVLIHQENTTARNNYSTTNLTDTSKWYHVVISVDTASSTADNRIRLYIDGQADTFSSRNNPGQNETTEVSVSGVLHTIGYGPETSLYTDGQIADFHFIDGQALTAADFGEDVSGTWSAKDYTGTYGSNGYHLDFTDGANLGTDNSGNGNNWTEVSLTAVDNQDAITTSDIPQVIPEATTLRTRGYLGAAPAAAAGDEYWDDVSLLIRGDTQTDLSANAHTLTFTGATANDPDPVKFATGSLYFDGSEDYITVPDAAAKGMGSSDFTVEGWFRTASTARQFLLGDLAASGSGISCSMFMQIHTAGDLRLKVSDGTSEVDLTGPTSAISTNTWYHIAAVRSGNTLSLYLDGVLQDSGAITLSLQDNAIPYRIGRSGEYTANSGFNYNGNIEDVRITKGVARYTAAFTPPTASFLTNAPQRPAGMLTLYDRYVDTLG